MQNIQRFSAENDIAIRWFEPLGRAIKFLIYALNWQNLSRFDWHFFRSKCYWMGVGSLPFITLSSVFISLALTLQTILEMREFRAQDLSGPIVAISLLRELGPITISLAWTARITAHLCAEGQSVGADLSDSDYAAYYALPNLLAALTTALPLSAYGLVIGFLTAAFFAPTLGVSSTNDFLETARLYIKDKDVFAYFVKLILINPTIAVLVGSAYGRDTKQSPRYASANAVTAAFIIGYVGNWLFTYLVFSRT